MKKRREEGSSQEWLNTYADMITLVLTFFVLLYSISNINIVKLQQVAEAMRKKLGIEVTVELSDLPKELKYPTIGEATELVENPAKDSQDNESPGSVPEDSDSSQAMIDMAREIQEYFAANNIDTLVYQNRNAVYIRFKNDLLFTPDSAKISDTSKTMLQAIGTMLKTRQDMISAVYINGHTAQASTSLVNDRLLSSERADNVAIYLEEEVGFAPEKLICRGYGKHYPIADNSTKEGRELNRRVDMIILGSDFKLSEISENDRETLDPLFPIGMPNNMNGTEEGTDQ